MAVGSIYAIQPQGIERFEMVGGPSARLADGGHSADPTPKGRFTLDKQEMHVTLNWPNSSIPWGAELS